MHQKHLNTLEFPKILERLAAYAAFSASKSLALALQPTPYVTQARQWQAETTEADELLSVKPNLGVGGSRDVRPHVARSHRGITLTPQELLEIRQTLTAARELARTLARLADDYPRLADIAGRIDPCTGLVNAISQAIDDHGEVKSSASPALARIRRDIDIAHSRLMEKLNRLLTSSASQYLQEALITQRGGRYVIPVKADFKGRVRGIVHDQSASGATVFVEPLATVELNNQWRQLQIAEDEEIRRILAELAAQVSEQGQFIDHTVAALAELDLAFAKAKYAQAIDAVEPELLDAASGGFRLLTARHPLLDPKTVVPITVDLADDTRMLVITGPNTGGKTVSLKTVGLLTAMAQAGLRIPAAEGSTVRLFRHIFADIGDEQSIEQSLSTFSGHMTNIVQILADCDDESLVIFDELGAGTDPVEGSALARAILTDLLARNVTTFVATHYSELKAFAHTTPGVANASMEFNVETLTPTYRLRIGLPGESNAFTIAGRLGLPAAVISAARGLVGENARQVEAMLAEIKSQADAARQQRREVEAVKAELQQRLDEIDAERRDILNAARDDARREIKAVRQRIRDMEESFSAELEQRRAELTAAPASAPAPEAAPLEAELEQLAATIEPEKKPEPIKKAPPPPIGPVRVGDTVYVPQFATTGQVVSITNGQAEVQLGHFRATAPLKNLERRKAAAPEPVLAPTTTVEPAADSPGIELDLRGRMAEEAMVELDHYLDRAFRARLPWVRIIHGRGSGVLRQVVRDELRRHALVSSYQAGKEGEGGDGVTVAKLAVN
ncbi:MAG: endonuclease MutS2 [Anaerolineae bacterium]